ncbi:flagellar filament capping protein FliD [Massilia rhizosphaerae]|uniref:flagellar filament capping protein FliD n=1 Tax=Massilia rhizosphaerae TaxID=2784389 RepID=UPI0018DCA6C1
MGISSPGIGSGLDVNGLVSKLMAAESQPLSNYDMKTGVYQGKLQAYGQVSSAVGAFQSALSTLNSTNTFSALTAKSSNDALLSATASTGAVPGKYKINVSQLAQAQSLMTGGQAGTGTQIGDGSATTLTFQFGSVSGGTFGVAGSVLGASTAASGIASGSLTINGTAISTNGTTRSARDLAQVINDVTSTTGVTAKAGTTTTSATLFSGFGDVTVASGGSYALSVGGVTIDSSTGSTTVTAASIDAALATTGVKDGLAAANITMTGTAAGGNLQFFAADGSNIDIKEAVSGTVTGGIGLASTAANTGSDNTTTAGVTLSSADGSQIVIGGNAPAAAGLTAGSAGSHIGASFVQDGAQASGTVTLDTKDQTLQGIRDAINKANVGVTATIVSDGSASPYHLVVTSNKTGEKSSMKISVDGANGGPVNAGIASLLGYDPGGTQNLTQTSGAQDTKLTMNGIAVSSASTTVSDVVQGVSMDLNTTGSTTLTVAQDTSTVSTAINGFVKAYNDMNSTISKLTAYDPTTKTGAVLQGDSAVRAIQTQLRRALGASVAGLDSNMTNLTQVGISFAQDGSMTVDSGKLGTAISTNFNDIAGLFAAAGSASDGGITYNKSGAATQPGEYAVSITQMATQGTLTSANALSGSTTIASNTTWTVTLNQTDPVTDSKVQNIQIAAGTYTNDQLSSMLRAAINGNSTFSSAGDSVQTSIDGTGHLAISSSKYGSASNISIASVTGTLVSDIFGAATPAVGTDVQGTIGGVAATGNGQVLTAADGSKAAGIQLTVGSGTVGDRGTVSFSQGYAYALTNLAASFTGKNSLLASKTDGLNASIKRVAQQRDQFSQHLTQVEAMYRAQFTSLDTMISSMQSTQSYLTQQLAAIAANR